MKSRTVGKRVTYYKSSGTRCALGNEKTAGNGWKRRANAWKRLKPPPKPCLLQGSWRVSATNSDLFSKECNGSQRNKDMIDSLPTVWLKKNRFFIYFIDDENDDYCFWHANTQVIWIHLRGKDVDYSDYLLTCSQKLVFQ
jgi:hypothetical protein